MYAVFTLVSAFVVLGVWVYSLSNLGGAGPKGLAELEGMTQTAAFNAGEVVPAANSDYARPTVIAVGAISSNPDDPEPVKVVASEIPATAAPTFTPTATMTPTVTPTLDPTQVQLEIERKQFQAYVQMTQLAPEVGAGVAVRVASYWPDDGPDWCLTWDDDAGCLSMMTSGQDWRDSSSAAACNWYWLGSTIVIDGVGAFQCLDTGPDLMCDTQGCDVLILSRAEWPAAEYSAKLYERGW